MSSLSFPTALAPPTNVLPFQLLEINLISAQDLARVGRGMRTYAVAWVHPERKLSTRLDTHGHTDPTWNDKFVFRVDDAFLQSDTSAVMIEIYAVRCFRDVCVGIVRVLVGNLIPPSSRNQQNSGMRFVALQVRRPSGRPQGILNIGVALLDGSMRSMPLYTQLSSSAVGYRDLMGEESRSPNHHHHQKDHKKGFHMRRSVSERRSEVTSNDFPQKPGSTVNGSEIGEPPLATVTTGSVWSMSDVGPAPSVVAAAMAEDQLYPVAEVVGSNNNVLEDWEAEASVEGLRSKLERWRTELPPIYDRGRGTYRANGERPRRHTDGGGGLLSCFGDMYGFECSISCGLKPRGKGGKGKSRLSNFDDDGSQSYMP
ncbi:C2 calcium-dependent membrane targeting [Macleaya cordata]|uniref:C2 calcium-dependent membrane targeting n=1 Tax=Macleaya cordata TaxID=56857 RepID=A0A200PZP2_MACCD|nr:C2 calcium-dependent membrane targeting [Macleaya cordata]